MAKVDYDNLEQGRALDVLVAEKVMGWKVLKVPDHTHTKERAWFATEWHNKEVQGPGDRLLWTPDNHSYGWFKFWQPSTDIVAAWEVVEKLNELGYDVEINSATDVCTVGVLWYDNRGWKYGNYTEARSVAHAICIAALKELVPIQAAKGL